VTRNEHAWTAVGKGSSDPVHITWLNSFDDPQANYEKLEFLGEGTFGIVHKYRCKRTQDIVAIKKIRLKQAKVKMRHPVNCCPQSLSLCHPPSFPTLLSRQSFRIPTLAQTY
jgi:serine/threonine protein kinase